MKGESLVEEHAIREKEGAPTLPDSMDGTGEPKT